MNCRCQKTGTASALLLWLLTIAAAQARGETFFFTNLNRSIPDGNASGLSDVRTVQSALGSISSVRVRLRIVGEFNGDLYGYLRHTTGFSTNQVTENFELAEFVSRPGLVRAGNGVEMRACDPVGSGANFQLSVRTEKGCRYFLEYADEPSGGPWTSLPEFQGDGNVHILIDPAAQSPRRFYRVRRE